jgi:phage FluMu protein Com
MMKCENCKKITFMKNKIENLTKISREKSLFFENFYDWESYEFSEDML